MFKKNLFPNRIASDHNSDRSLDLVIALLRMVRMVDSICGQGLLLEMVIELGRVPRFGLGSKVKSIFEIESIYS